MESKQKKVVVMSGTQVYKYQSIPKLKQEYRKITPTRPTFQVEMERGEENSKMRKIFMIPTILFSTSLIILLIYLIPYIVYFFKFVDYYHS